MDGLSSLITGDVKMYNGHEQRLPQLCDMINTERYVYRTLYKTETGPIDVEMHRNSVSTYTPYGLKGTADRYNRRTLRNAPRYDDGMTVINILESAAHQG